MKAIRYRLGLVLGLVFLLSPAHPTASQKTENQKQDEPTVVDFEEMRYPLAARLKHSEGVVVIQVKLSKDGKVLGTDALSGPKDLIPDSLSNVKTWRFAPNSHDSAIGVYWFHIEGLCHGYGSSQFAFFASNFARVTSCEAHIEP